jgi:hypothetical protein
VDVDERARVDPTLSERPRTVNRRATDGRFLGTSGGMGRQTPGEDWTRRRETAPFLPHREPRAIAPRASAKNDALSAVATNGIVRPCEGRCHPCSRMASHGS